MVILISILVFTSGLSCFQVDVVVILKALEAYAKV